MLTLEIRISPHGGLFERGRGGGGGAYLPKSVLRVGDYPRGRLIREWGLNQSFTVYINNILYFIDERNVADYADDNTQYAIDTIIDSLLGDNGTDVTTLIKWCCDNYLEISKTKCCQLILNQEDDCISVCIGNENIKNSKSEKLIGITIDSKLNLDEYITMLCKEVNLKLHALARISKFMNRKIKNDNDNSDASPNVDVPQ